MPENTLRSRILSGFVLLGIVQFILMTAIAIYSYHRGEDNSLSQLIQSDLNFLEFTSLDPLPDSLPEQVSQLQAGVHELSGQDKAAFNGIELHAFVYQTGDTVNYRILQFSEQGNWSALLKEYALFAGIALLLLLCFGGWAGHTIAQRVSKPMETLAHKLAIHQSIEPAAPFFNEQLTGETAIVAKSLDDAFERIRKTREREQTLSRNISHELRTPLTVIRTALDTGTTERHRPSENALASARRACDEMELLTAACLELAREDDVVAADAQTNVVDTIKQIVRESLHLLDGKRVELDLTVAQQEIMVPASESLIRLIAGNVIRNAFIHSSTGDITIELNRKELLVINQSEVEAGHSRQQGNGFGMGLSILGQACNRLGWDFDLQIPATRHSPEARVSNSVLSIVRFTKS